MANKRREANRRRSAMDQRESTHREPRYSGEGSIGTRGKSSGSHAHVGESFGPGPVPGAGELTNNSMPGAAAKRVRPNTVENPVRKTPDGAAPKGMRVEREGE